MWYVEDIYLCFNVTKNKLLIKHFFIVLYRNLFVVMLTPCESCGETTNFTFRARWRCSSWQDGEYLVVPLCKGCLRRPGSLEGYVGIERPQPGYKAVIMVPGTNYFQNWISEEDEIQRCHNDCCQQVPAWPAYIEKDDRDECIGRFCKQCLMNKLMIASALDPARKPFDYVEVHHLVIQDTRLAMWMLEDHPVVKAFLWDA